MAGEKYKPKKIQMRGGVKETVGLADGSIDREPGEAQALAGIFTRRVMADPPGAFIFHCVCGHKRRVLFSEKHFRCENGDWPNLNCDILWTQKQKESGEYDEETGKAVMAPVTEKQVMEVPDEFTGKKRKVEIDVPVIEGRRLGEVKREEFAKRRAAGKPEIDEPQLVAKDGSQQRTEKKG